MKLKTKLLLPPLLLFALALSVSGWYAYNIAHKELEVSMLETLATSSESLAFSLDDVVSNIVQDIKGISIIPPVMVIMSMQNRPDAERYKALQAELDYSMQTRSLIKDGTYKNLDISNSKGIIISGSDLKHVDTKIKPTKAYFEAMASGKVQIGPPQSEAIGQAEVPFYMPVKLDDKVVGCIIALVNFNVLGKTYVDRIKLKNGYGFIVGPGGIIMYHPNANLIMEPVDSEDLADPSVQMSKMGNGTLEYEWQGEPWFAMFQTGKESNWTSVVKANLHELYYPISVVQR